MTIFVLAYRIGFNLFLIIGLLLTYIFPTHELNQPTKTYNIITLTMLSLAITRFFLLLVALLVALLTIPILNDYIEHPGYPQSFGELEARTPMPECKKGSTSKGIP